MKNILILSGVHGNELNAVKLGMMLKQEYSSDDNIDIIPWVNESGLLANTREINDNSTDDMNRMGGENFDSTKMMKEIKYTIVNWADLVIDIHNSPNCANFVLTGMTEADKVINTICLNANVEVASRFSNSKTLKDFANRNNKFGITYEFRGMNGVDCQTENTIAYEDIKNIIKEFQEGSWETSHDPFVKLSMVKEIKVSEKGFVEYFVEVNEIVEENTLIARILDIDNNAFYTIRAPCKCKILDIEPAFVDYGDIIILYKEV